MLTMASNNLICLAFFLTYIVINNAFLLDSFPRGNGVNIFCIVQHCAGLSAACVGDSNCLKSLTCIQSCGLSNISCTFQCADTYEDKAFDLMMKCLAEDNKCLTLQPTDPNFQCSPPQQPHKDFNLSQLQGSWWIVYGLNQYYDCYDCRQFNYKPGTTSSSYTAEEKYNVVMKNGTVRQRVTQPKLEQKDASNGGALDYSNMLLGLAMSENWQVLEYAPSGNYMIVYYCGHVTDAWTYEGILVHSRQPTLSQDDNTAVTNFLQTKMGHNINDYCTPNTSNCQA